MPFVSVIIPTYNRARYVTKAIDSIKAQRFRDCEIIVVDDGSTDCTGDVLKPYMSWIRYIRQDNAGVSAARNRGIREAQGTWIGFLDSDDEWLEDYLETQVAGIRLFPQAVAHITDCVGFSPKLEQFPNHFKEINLLPKFRSERLFVPRPFHTIVSSTHWFVQSILMNRERLLESGIFNPHLSIAEDMDVLARLALKGPITFDRRVLVQIYRREEGITCLSSQRMNRGIYCYKSFAKVFSDLMQMPGLTFLEKAALARGASENWRTLGNIYLQNQNRRQARHYYRKAMIYPTPKLTLKYLGSLLPRDMAQLVIRRTDIIPGDEID